eukprot:jgi/Ulvmu1/6852/UM031_0057.1
MIAETQTVAWCREGAVAARGIRRMLCMHWAAPARCGLQLQARPAFDPITAGQTCVHRCRHAPKRTASGPGGAGVWVGRVRPRRRDASAAHAVVQHSTGSA